MRSIRILLSLHTILACFLCAFTREAHFCFRAKNIFAYYYLRFCCPSPSPHQHRKWLASASVSIIAVSKRWRNKCQANEANRAHLTHNRPAKKVTRSQKEINDLTSSSKRSSWLRVEPIFHEICGDARCSRLGSTSAQRTFFYFLIQILCFCLWLVNKNSSLIHLTTDQSV